MGMLYFLVAAFFSEIIATIAGFGAATILTPIGVFFFDIKEVVLLVAVYHLFAEGFPALLFRKYIQWRSVFLFGLPALFTTVIGARLITVLPSAVVRQALGWFLVAWALISFFNTKFRLPPKPTTMLSGGLLSGFIAGLIGTGGAIRSLALTSFGLEREKYLGTSAAIALAVDLTRVPLYLTAGIGSVAPPFVAGLAGVALLGALIGRKIVFRIPPTIFRKAVLVAIFLAGLRFVIG